MARANQITQVVTGLNKTGAYSVNPITFPLTQVSIDACRVHIKKLRGETKYLIPALRKKRFTQTKHSY